MHYKFTRKSSNTKTGPIPVTITERKSCPPTCPFAGDGGCYAEGYPLKLHWDAVSDGSKACSLEELCDSVAALPDGQLWRHNQAGDLPGEGSNIDADALQKIVDANKGRRGFTYTHKALDSWDNLLAVRRANQQGFTVNISANDAAEAAQLRKAHPDIPVVCVLPSNHTERRIQVDGVAVITCPATLSDSVNCSTCGLCQVRDRGYVVGFPAHGVRKRKVDAIAAF